MKNKDREKLSIVFRIGALIVAVIILVTYVLQGFVGAF